MDMEALQDYLAKKIDEGFDEMIQKGEITPEIIEQWGKEHMRTPYRPGPDIKEWKP
jgi:hypothetical protein